MLIPVKSAEYARAVERLFHAFVRTVDEPIGRVTQAAITVDSRWIFLIH